ncbi:helix-turn-helix domain-containing protein, partial [Streptomyces sp. NPDC060031]
PVPPPPAPVAEAAPSAPAPARQDARDLLARLRCEDPRLLLAARDVERLAPGVSQWLDRGAEPDAVRRILAADLPADLRYAPGLLAHRLAAQLPPHLPAPPPPERITRPDPLQTCDGCERAFRAPAPGRCRDCPPEQAAAA